MKMSMFLTWTLSGLIMLVSQGTYMRSGNSGSGLKVGSGVPEFVLPDQDGKLFDLKDVLGKKNLVIFFYVRDETPGCTKEACTFRDDFTEFQNADAAIIGISAQSVESHRKFAE